MSIPQIPAHQINPYYQPIRVNEPNSQLQYILDYYNAGWDKILDSPICINPKRKVWEALLERLQEYDPEMALHIYRDANPPRLLIEMLKQVNLPISSLNSFVNAVEQLHGSIDNDLFVEARRVANLRAYNGIEQIHHPVRLETVLSKFDCGWNCLMYRPYPENPARQIWEVVLECTDIEADEVKLAADPARRLCFLLHSNPNEPLADIAPFKNLLKEILGLSEELHFDGLRGSYINNSNPQSTSWLAPFIAQDENDLKDALLQDAWQSKLTVLGVLLNGTNPNFPRHLVTQSLDATGTFLRLLKAYPNEPLADFDTFKETLLSMQVDVNKVFPPAYRNLAAPSIKQQVPSLEGRLSRVNETAWLENLHRQANFPALCFSLRHHSKRNPNFPLWQLLLDRTSNMFPKERVENAEKPEEEFLKMLQLFPNEKLADYHWFKRSLKSLDVLQVDDLLPQFPTKMPIRDGNGNLSFQQLLNEYDIGSIAEIFYRKSSHDKDKTIWQQVLGYLPNNFPSIEVINNPDPARMMLSLIGVDRLNSYGELADIESFLGVLALLGVDRKEFEPPISPR